MKHKEKYILLFVVIVFRLLFVFTDAFFSQKKNKEEPIQPVEYRETIPQQNEQAITEKTLQELEVLGLYSGTIQETSLQGMNQGKISPTEDIRILEAIYQQNKKPEILKVLIQKLIQNHQFVKAKEYLLATTFQQSGIDPAIYLYVFFNGIQLTSQTDMEYFKGMLEQYKSSAIIAQDEYNFYRGLINIRDHNYQNVDALFIKVKDAKYTAIIQQIQTIITNAKLQKDMPAYYQDCLVGLSLLKNGYFSIAKRLAMDSTSQNDSYILPYQILAYEEFLTNNYESAMTYFLKLKDNDPTNVQMYTFYIGICAYWTEKYNDALLYLDQVSLPELKTDVYRYELLIYLATNDIQKQLTIWQKILGQDDLAKEDFYQFFYEVLYRPFSLGKEAEIYLTNPDLSFDVVNLCYEKIPQDQQDVCIYGEVGLDVLKENRIEVKNNLLYLADKYPNAYIYQALGDYYTSQNLSQEAKTYYLKAISSSVNEEEKQYLKSKMIDQMVVQ